MSTIEKAIALAARKHAGQKDKAQQPYIFHPLRLMFKVKTPNQQDCCCITRHLGRYRYHCGRFNLTWL